MNSEPQKDAQTLAIDLSIPWKNTTVSAVVTDKPSNFPFARRPTLWYDSTADLVYSIGGFPYSDAKINGSTIWAFQPDGNGGAPWQKNTSEGDLLWSQITPTFGALTATSDDSFYSLGGSIPPSSNDFAGTPSVAQSGMAVFEFQSNTWKNLSSSGYQASGFGVMGQAEYVGMFGKKGTIVFLGGDAPTGSFYSYATGSSLVDMSVVSIYDIDSGNWLTQQTTGDIPDRRYAFCMAGAAEKDAKSYEL